MTAHGPNVSTAGQAARQPVDLRPLVSSILMDQGARPVCVPFALSLAHEAVTASNSDPAMAPEAIWWRASSRAQVSAGGMLLEDAGDALTATGQPPLNDWPWNPLLGAGTEPPPPAAGTPPWRTATMEELALAHDGVEDELEDALAAGSPIVLVVEVTTEFENATAEGLIEIPDIRSPAGDYHAVLVVGATTDPDHGRLLLIRNSWSKYWGAGGYGWLPTDYLIAHAVQAAIVVI
mgnify:CR=1 FL=1